MRSAFKTITRAKNAVEKKSAKKYYYNFILLQLRLVAFPGNPETNPPHWDSGPLAYRAFPERVASFSSCCTVVEVASSYPKPQPLPGACY